MIAEVSLDPYKDRVPAYVLAFTPNLISALRCAEDLGTDKKKTERFIRKHAIRNLCCFGAKLSGLRNKPNPRFTHESYTKSVLKQIKLLEKDHLRDNMIMYVDSGGFQCIMGYISADHVLDYMKCYCDFLNRYKTNFSYAFSLDLPPNDFMFKTIKEAREFNIATYRGLSELVDEEVMKSKIIFVYHFTSMRIWNVWNDILDYADNFSSYWSAAGIARKKTFQRPSVWLYTPVLLRYIRYFQNNDPSKLNNLKFHILGDFTPLTILFSKLVSEYLRRVYNIKLYITYDASSICVGNLRHRFINVFRDKDHVWHYIDLKRRERDKRNPLFNNKRNSDIALEEIQSFAEHEGFKLLPYDDIDDPKKDNFWSEVGHYLILYMVYQYSKLEQYCYEIAPELISLYLDEKYEQFSKEVFNILIKISGGSLSRYLSTKKRFVLNTFDAFELLQTSDDKKLLDKCVAIIQTLKDWNNFAQDIPTW